MINKDLEQKILKAAEKDVPDIRHKLNMNRAPKPKENRWLNILKRPVLKVSYGVVAAVMLFAVLINITPVSTPATTNVFIEFNPGLSFTLDDDDKLIGFDALNADGEAFIDKLKANQNLEDLTLTTTIDLIIETAIEEGYLTGEEAAILYDVSGTDLTQAETVLNKLESAINTSTSNRNINPTIARGMASTMQETVSAAQEANMSVMKYHMIISILEDTDDYTFETLSEYSIKALMDLSDHHPGPPIDMPGRPQNDMTPGGANHPGRNRP